VYVRTPLLNPLSLACWIWNLEAPDEVHVKKMPKLPLAACNVGVGGGVLAPTVVAGAARAADAVMSAVQIKRRMLC
jgi:hypothetical protein